MATVEDLFPRPELDAAIEAGLVRTQRHPSLPLFIFNYTEKTAYEGVWTEVTLQCRGLILDDEGTVVARPFRKFFNHGQAGAPEFDLSAPVSVTDKMDGSLGILYPVPGGHAIATRGSFTSDQALHATAVWEDRYQDEWTPWGGVTYLFEIVYPQNRIVVNYGDFDDLVLLDVLDNVTGRPATPLGAATSWPGPDADVFLHRTLAEALAAEPRPNAEGYVIYFPDHDERLKLKQSDYVALHRIVTGLNARTVWEHLCAGLPIADLIEPLPDEFHQWVRDVESDLLLRIYHQRDALHETFSWVMRQMPEGYTRKEFALLAKEQKEDAWAMFLLLDGRSIMPELWKRAKPEAFITPSGMVYSEDTA